jgi:hypothetical protein
MFVKFEGSGEERGIAANGRPRVEIVVWVYVVSIVSHCTHAVFTMVNPSLYPL